MVTQTSRPYPNSCHSTTFLAPLTNRCWEGKKIESIRSTSSATRYNLHSFDVAKVSDDLTSTPPPPRKLFPSPSSRRTFVRTSVLYYFFFVRSSTPAVFKRLFSGSIVSNFLPRENLAKKKGKSKRL